MSATPNKSSPSSPVVTVPRSIRSPFKANSARLLNSSQHSLGSGFGDSNSNVVGGIGVANHEPLPKRVRKVLEPLVMSIVTTILVFHVYFSGDSGHPGELFASDSPSFPQPSAIASLSSSSSSLSSQSRIKTNPPPPPFSYHDKLGHDTSTPIFFHIFIPQGNASDAHRIVREQLQQIGVDSQAPQLTNKTITVFYQTVGASDNTEMNVAAIQAMCVERKMQCHHMGHFDQGREEVTLHRVQEFCQADARQNPNKQQQRRVMYLHNKGSHHTSTINERWRKKLTQAVTHPKCLSPPMEACNICSLFLTAERGIFMAGNFWVAECDYIVKLLPPLEFEGHMERVVKEALFQQMTHERFHFATHKHWPPSFGTGRYAAEYWAGSHPTVMPCDFSFSFKVGNGNDNTLDFLKWVNSSKVEQQPAKTLRWTMAPKHPLKLTDKSLANHSKRRLKEYFLLAGNILRWYELYGEVPGEFSWVWAWYPDGRKWLAAVHKHGRKAIEVLTNTGDDVFRDHQ